MELENILKTIIHPELGVDIVSLGLVGNVKNEEQSLSITIRMVKPNDPAAGNIRRAVERALTQEFPTKKINIIISDPVPENKREKEHKEMKTNTTTNDIGKVIAISSGKGGVGKSSVTANLAIALKNLGYKVGVLDADIYGPSMPKMFGVEGYVPLAESETSQNILPAIAFDIKIMSIGFFIEAHKALVWRGPMATSALRQMTHQTAWGKLDYLLIDLPPGTGDVHLTIVNEIKINQAVIVTTPQAVALADVVRGIDMFKNDNVNIEVCGVVENMAYFTPKDAPDKKYYIFGQGKIEAVCESVKLPVLAQIPIDESVSAGGDDGAPYCQTFPDSTIAHSFRELAKGL